METAYSARSDAETEGQERSSTLLSFPKEVGIQTSAPAELRDPERMGLSTEPMVQNTNIVGKGHLTDKEDGSMENDKLFDILREDRAISEDRLNRNMERLEDRLATSQMQSEERVTRAIEKMTDETKATRKWVAGLVISTVLAIGAMVLTAILQNQ